MGFVTVNIPLTSVGIVHTVAHVGAEALEVDSSVNSAELDGQLTIMFVPDITALNCGGTTAASARLNTVPDPDAPPSDVVP